jgi:hypothetical protein
VAERLGRDVTVGSIRVSLGRAVIRDLTVRGPRDAGLPLARVGRIEVSFDPWRSLVGVVRVGEVTADVVVVSVRRRAGGDDNVSDLLARIREPSGASPAGPGTQAGLRPGAIAVRGLRIVADDEVTSSTALVADGSARWTPAGWEAELRGITATSITAPRAAVERIAVRKEGDGAPTVAIEGGEVALYPRLALSGIAGTIHPNGARPATYRVDLAGGYGGVPGALWTAKGALDPQAGTASLELEAAKFQLERLAPILARTAVVDYASTAVDTKLQLELSRDGARFSGELHLTGLNVGHPMLADQAVHGLDLAGTIAGAFDRAARRFELVRGDFVARGVPFSVTGFAIAPPRAAAPAEAPQPPDRGAGAVAKGDPGVGPGGLQQLALRLVIPPAECQRVLDAIPKEMAPHMAGYQLKGQFDTDLQLAIDWRDLDATVLDGHVGIRKCRVTREPPDSPKRLLDEFEHHVEYEAGKWMSFVVGPSNDDFVPLEDISPYLIKSIMSTEDSTFYSHRGFIVSEFRTALVNDLKAGRFSYGASSITMQMVKNVLLFRDKTLARKLQELFLTWHVENTLEKDRILEIYFNVIEYGPALYGIGPAARHYFAKDPRDLTPVEAAFFSSILPAPKPRYRQYCNGTLTRWTEGKIKLILGVMLKRNRLTQEEYDEAVLTPLSFAKDGEETEAECLQRTQKAIKNARSTNPMKRAGSTPPSRPKPKARSRDRGEPGDRDPDDARERRERRQRARDNRLPV